MASLIRALIAAFALSGINSAHAVLIDFGDVTFDTRSRLEWLDLTVTQGLTYQQIVDGAGDYLSNGGWRYANGSEIDSLFSFYTGVEEPGDPEARPLTMLRTVRLIDLLGATISFNMSGGTIVVNGDTYPVQIGLVGFYDDLTGGDRVGIGELIARFSFASAPDQCQQCVIWDTLDDFILSNDLASPALGSFLVRDRRSVPEPDSFALLAVGLLALGLMRRRTAN